MKPVRMELELEHEFDAMVGPLELLVAVDFTPGRPAPACSNPDSPAFADSGDPEDWQIIAVRFKNGGHLATNVWSADEAFDEAVGSAAIEQYQEMVYERATGEGY